MFNLNALLWGHTQSWHGAFLSSTDPYLTQMLSESDVDMRFNLFFFHFDCISQREHNVLHIFVVRKTILQLEHATRVKVHLQEGGTVR